MSLKLLPALLAIALFLAACAPPSPALHATPSPAPSTAPTAVPTPSPTVLSTASGLEGQVVVGPMCPVVKEDEPCPDRPYQATISVLDKAGRQVTRFETDTAGRFHLELQPGIYTVVPEPPPDQRYPVPPGQFTVTVTAGQFTSVTIGYDSGIR